MEALRSVWIGLARRERVLASIGLAVVGGALLFAVAIEPAWRTRARLESELPGLREQGAEVTALAQEAEALRGRAGTRVAGPELKMAIEQSLARAGLRAESVTGPGVAQLTIRGKALPAGVWLGWLEQTVRQMRLRVASARIARSGAAGTIDSEVTLDSAGGR
jgi:general secretion pathway protein M